MKQLWRTWLKVILATAMFAGFILSACAAASRSENYASPKEGIKMVSPLPATEAPALKAYQSGGMGEESSPEKGERLVIKNANLSIVVPDPVLSLERISNMAEEMGGFVVSANMYKQTLSSGVEVPRGSVVIRVPAEQLNQALTRIRAESDELPQTENINSQDITNEYVDLQSRLKNLEAAETELTKIMKDARKTEDVLSVYNQLVSIREQIEVIKGQIKYYEESTNLSSISVELIADKAVQPIEIGGWKPVGIAKRAIESLIKALQSLLTAAIWIVLFFIPILLVIFIIFILPIILVVRALIKRRNAKRSSKKPADPVA